MLKIEEAVLINKYAQNIMEMDIFINKFSLLDLSEKRNYLREIVSLIQQSKPTENDIIESINKSKLKPSYTPCILLKKGIENHKLQNIINLPENELKKSLILLLTLFQITYLRRFMVEKNNPDKWWFWDLSDPQNVEKIISEFS